MKSKEELIKKKYRCPFNHTVECGYDTCGNYIDQCEIGMARHAFYDGWNSRQPEIDELIRKLSEVETLVKTSLKLLKRQ